MIKSSIASKINTKINRLQKHIPEHCYLSFQVHYFSKDPILRIHVFNEITGNFDHYGEMLSLNDPHLLEEVSLQCKQIKKLYSK